MHEQLAGDRDRQLRRAREVGLRRLAGPMQLRERDQLLGPALRHATASRAAAACAAARPRSARDAAPAAARTASSPRARASARAAPRSPASARSNGSVRVRHLRGVTSSDGSLPPATYFARRLPIHAGFHRGHADTPVLAHLFHQLPHLRVARWSHRPCLHRREEHASTNERRLRMGRCNCRRRGGVTVAQQSIRPASYRLKARDGACLQTRERCHGQEDRDPERVSLREGWCGCVEATAERCSCGESARASRPAAAPAAAAARPRSSSSTTTDEGTRGLHASLRISAFHDRR